MRKLVIVVILVLVPASSEARHWRWHWHSRHFAMPPYAYGFAPLGYKQRGWGRREGINPAAMVPPNWQLQPADQNWQGRRFVSPDGSSWLAAYSFPTANESMTKHLQSVAFAEGETVTYLRGEHDWIVVSGTKDDRIFYRKATVACGGKVWHHIAFEYPGALRREMDPYVLRAAAIIDRAQNDGCGDAAASVAPDR